VTLSWSLPKRSGFTPTYHLNEVSIHIKNIFNVAVPGIRNFPGESTQMTNELDSCVWAMPIDGGTPVSSEISDFTPCTHAQSNILPFKYAEISDD